MGFWLARGALGRICVSPSFYSSAINSGSGILRLPIALKKNKEAENPWVTRRKQKPSRKQRPNQNQKPSQNREQNLMQRPKPSPSRGPGAEAAGAPCRGRSNTSYY